MKRLLFVSIFIYTVTLAIQGGMQIDRDNFCQCPLGRVTSGMVLILNQLRSCSRGGQTLLSYYIWQKSDIFQFLRDDFFFQIETKYTNIVVWPIYMYKVVGYIIYKIIKIEISFSKLSPIKIQAIISLYPPVHILLVIK